MLSLLEWERIPGGASMPKHPDHGKVTLCCVQESSWPWVEGGDEGLWVEWFGLRVSVLLAMLRVLRPLTSLFLPLPFLSLCLAI